MNKICTSVKQSRKLIKLGIDIDTADMHYMYRHWEIDENTIGSQSDASIGFDSDFYYGADNGQTYHYIPAWSLAALFKIIANAAAHIDEDGYLDATVCKDVHCVSLINCNGELYKADNLVDACYEMILKLHELNLL